MAPRRLLIAMVLLLAFSTALAILVPTPEREQRREQEPPPEAVERPVEPRPERREEASPQREVESVADRTLERSIDAGGSAERLTVRPGDRLVLEVGSREVIVLELAGTGLVDTAGPYDPARFELLLRDRPKQLILRELGTRDGKVAVIDVR